QLNTEADIDSSTSALEEVLVTAAGISTPQQKDVQKIKFKTNQQIEQLIQEKRRLRRAWLTNRSPCSKQRLNEATSKLSRALKQDAEKGQLRYIEKLSPTSTKHPLWRAHPNLSSPAEAITPIRKSSGCWARSDKDRAETFASHLQGVFQPNTAAHPFELPQNQTETESTPASFRPNEITKVIRELKPKKAPGDDLITQKMIIELPNCAIEVICKIFNAIITQLNGKNL
ncbi:hypothetical protein KR059_000211, partial [Drosophila kikkawai]